MERHSYFYPGSFKLKLLQSTRQGDFTFLNKDLINYNQTDYNYNTKLLWLTIQSTSKLTSD